MGANLRQSTLSRVATYVAAAVWLASTAYAQTASEMPQNPTCVLQLPLSGRSPQAGDVQVTQQTTNTGEGSSVVTTDSMVTVPAPYNGSVAWGKASDAVRPLTLADALGLAFKATLGALTQSAMEQQARGQRGIAKSDLLPQLNTVISEAFEKENFRTLGLKTPTIPSISTFNYYDARALRLNQSVFDLVRIRNLQGATENIDATVQAARNARDLIVLAVAGSYLQLVSTRARADAAAAQVASFSAIYKQAADRVEAGLATRVDALRASGAQRSVPLRCLQALLTFVILDLLPAQARGLKVFLRIALDLWLPVLAALKLIAQPLQPRGQLRPVDGCDIFLGGVEFMRCTERVIEPLRSHFSASLPCHSLWPCWSWLQ